MSRALVGRDGWAVALMGDAAAAAAYWAGRERKKFAVDVAAGPRAAPTYYATFYASARCGQGALKAVRDQASGLPARARYRVRLAGPQELGCVGRPAP